MDSIPIPIACSVCHQPVSPTAYFCPNCGNPLKAKPPSTAWFHQLGIYALSLFLPPLGLWPAFKYLKSDDEAARRVGWIAVALTVASIIITIWLTKALLQNLQSQLDSASLTGLST
jgi:hypothetical protein